MVSSSFSAACIVLVSFLALSSTTPSYANFTINNDICSNGRVLSRSFCSTFLGSNPIVIKSLLRSLAVTTIDLASSNATETSQQIPKWKNQTDNVQLKNAYNLCSKPYSQAISDLKEATEKVKSSDYDALARLAVDATVSFHSCTEKFEDIQPDSSPLSSASEELAVISSIMIAIFETLGKSSHE